MSQSDYDITDAKTTTGVDPKMADISGDEHALKEAFGSGTENKKFAFEAEIMAERIADWYDDPAAGLREYLSNAETACIRRAQMALRNRGFDVPDSTDAAIEKAIKKCDYQPTIEVTYNRNPESTRLVIEDNGCGITTREYQILRNIGYSASHDSGDRLGQFGMGVMSFLNLVGVEGMMSMSTHSYPAEDREETAYSLTMYATNMEYLDGIKENYGTRFEFPSFTEKARDIDIRERVADFVEGMRVPVLYREADKSGQEIYNEDYTPSALADDYADDELVISYENEYFIAVMSPSSPNNRGYKTYNISVPIRRNDGGRRHRGISRFHADWKWDFRGKSENGPIVASDDDSVIGLAPISDTKYGNLPDERADDFIPRSEVPDDAVVMPTPASSRDSYEGGHQEFWEYVSMCLQEEWKDEVAQRIDGLDDFDDFKDLDSREKHVIMRGYRKFGPGYSVNDPDNIAEYFKDELGVSVDANVAGKLDQLTMSERVVPRGTDTPQYKKVTRKKETWQIIDNITDSGTVYIGKTISPKKAEIAWALNDNNVIVRVEPNDSESTSECYERLQETWGWELLKELPTRKLKERLPSLPDDVAEKYETTSSKDMKQQSSGSRRTSRNPETKRIKVYGSKRRSRRGISGHRAKHVYDTLDGGDSIRGGFNTVRKLIVYYEGDVSLGTVKQHTRHSDIGVATVPKYVYNYLKDADNIYTSIDDLADEQRKNATIDFNGHEERLDQLDKSDLLFIGSHLEDHFANRRGELRSEVSSLLGEQFSRLAFTQKDSLKQYWAVDTDAVIVSTSSQHGLDYTRLQNESGKRISSDDMIARIDSPDNIDWDHPVMDAMNSHGRLSNNVKRTIVVAEYLDEHDCLPTVDD